MNSDTPGTIAASKYTPLRRYAAARRAEPCGKAAHHHHREMRNLGIVKRDEFWTVLTSSKFVDAMTDTARLIVPSPDLRDLPIVRKIPLANNHATEGSPTGRRRYTYRRGIS